LQLSKSGGGLVYLTAWQKIFNRAPEPVNDKFVIRSSFERTGRPLAALRAGEKALMKVQVKALKDADYVLIEIPVPAGCTYAEKKQAGWDTHREYLKDRVVIFVETMKTGDYTFEIELEPRYAGSYQLNPAKAELMYFPVFYGRNEVKKVNISK
jgi:alpha-2-macroglobulin